MHAAARRLPQHLVIPRYHLRLVMSRSAVRVRSSAPQLRLGNQAFATGGTSLAPKLESTYDNNATAAGDRRKSRRHLGKRNRPRLGGPGRSPGRAGRAGSRRDIGALPSTPVASQRRHGPIWWPGDASRPDSVAGVGRPARQSGSGHHDARPSKAGLPIFNGVACRSTGRPARFTERLRSRPPRRGTAPGGRRRG